VTERYLEAQAAVLGAALIDGDTVPRILHRTQEGDYTGSYRTIFQAIQRVFLAGKPVDPTTVSAALESGHQYDALLLQILELTPTAANVDAYIELTLAESKLNLMRDTGRLLQDCVSLDQATELWAKLNRSLGDRPSVRIVSMAQGLEDFYQRQQTRPELVPWGMDKLDAAVLAERGDFVVLGGYPSAGKTALSVQLAWAQAEECKVGYFSLETRPEKLIDRTVAMVTGVDFGRIKRHQLGQDDWELCARHNKALVGRKLEIIQAGGLSVPEIQALTLAGRYDVIYTDYLQLIRPDDPRRTDYEQVSQISRDLHTLAQTTGVTVVALSQLTRPGKTGEQERAPGLHSLRQSGQIEQDADSVLLLYLDNPKDRQSQRRLKIAKNKEGEAGGILLLDFEGKTQRFSPADTSGEIARELVERGKAAKQANRVHQIGIYELPPVQDPDAPFQEVPSDGA
jgi:replicative DNA helicase